MRLLLWLWVALFSLSGIVPVRAVDRAQEGASYRALLAAAVVEPSNGNLVALAAGIYALRRYDFDDGADRRALIEDLTKGTTAISGHARAIAEEVERSREIARQGDGVARVKYNLVRSKYLAHTLSHLPSPETVLVLGDYLGDERDTPPEELPFEGTRERDFVSCPENSWLAFYAISNLGLRDLPIKPKQGVPSGGYRHLPEMTEAMRQLRGWHAEMKAGRRPFSFLGEKVEYRFKPDGTWQTTPLAISDEALREEFKSTAPPPSAAMPASAEDPLPTSSTSSRWPWLTAVAVLLIATAAWISRRSKHRAAGGE